MLTGHALNNFSTTPGNDADLKDEDLQKGGKGGVVLKEDPPRKEILAAKMEAVLNWYPGELEAE